MKTFNLSATALCVLTTSARPQGVTVTVETTAIFTASVTGSVATSLSSTSAMKPVPTSVVESPTMPTMSVVANSSTTLVAATVPSSIPVSIPAIAAVTSSHTTTTSHPISSSRTATTSHTATSTHVVLTPHTATSCETIIKETPTFLSCTKTDYAAIKTVTTDCGSCAVETTVVGAPTGHVLIPCKTEERLVIVSTAATRTMTVCKTKAGVPAATHPVASLPTSLMTGALLTLSEEMSITKSKEAAATNQASMLALPMEANSPVIEVQVDMGLPFIAELVDEVTGDTPKGDTREI